MIAFIPARGGSKGLPNKNTRKFLDVPLIAHAIKSAKASKNISQVIVSTDDPEIYRIALEYGALDTFLRPKDLARDDSKAIDNYLYTLPRLQQDFGLNIDSFVVLQPTSPLRTTEDIDMAIDLFRRKSADSVVSYTEEFHPVVWHKYIDDDGKFENIFPESIENRQENRKSFYPNGAIYVFRYELIMQRRYYSERSFAYIMPRERSVDIDTLADFEYAEFLAKNTK